MVKAEVFICSQQRESVVQGELKSTTILAVIFGLGTAKDTVAQSAFLTHTYMNSAGQPQQETMLFSIEHRLAMDLLRGRDIDDIRKEVTEYGRGNAFEVRRRQEELMDRTIQFRERIFNNITTEVKITSYSDLEYSVRIRGGPLLVRVVDYDFDGNFFPVVFSRSPTERLAQAAPEPMQRGGGRVLGFDVVFPSWMASGNTLRLPFDGPANAEHFLSRIGNSSWFLKSECFLDLNSSWQESKAQRCWFDQVSVTHPEMRTAAGEEVVVYNLSYSSAEGGTPATVKFEGESIMTFELLEGPP